MCSPSLTPKNLVNIGQSRPTYITFRQGARSVRKRRSKQRVLYGGEIPRVFALDFSNGNKQASWLSPRKSHISKKFETSHQHMRPHLTFSNKPARSSVHVTHTTPHHTMPLQKGGMRTEKRSLVNETRKGRGMPYRGTVGIENPPLCPFLFKQYCCFKS